MAGHRITLKDLLNREPHPMPVRRVENSAPAGFRFSFGTFELDIDGHHVTGDLASGAGVGNWFVMMSFEHPELGRVEEVISFKDAIEGWVQSAIAAGPTPKVPDDPEPTPEEIEAQIVKRNEERAALDLPPVAELDESGKVKPPRPKSKKKADSHVAVDPYPDRIIPERDEDDEDGEQTPTYWPEMPLPRVDELGEYAALTAAELYKTTEDEFTVGVFRVKYQAAGQGFVYVLSINDHEIARVMDGFIHRAIYISAPPADDFRIEEHAKAINLVLTANSIDAKAEVRDETGIWLTGTLGERPVRRGVWDEGRMFGVPAEPGNPDLGQFYWQRLRGLPWELVDYDKAKFALHKNNLMLDQLLRSQMKLDTEGDTNV